LEPLSGPIASKLTLSAGPAKTLLILKHKRPYSTESGKETCCSRCSV